MFGLALFALASVGIAVAHVPAMLLAGRAMQGLAAALAVPATLAAISEASSAERRASAIGAWAGFLMLGFSLGPLIGGVLTHYVRLARDLLGGRRDHARRHQWFRCREEGRDFGQPGRSGALTGRDSFCSPSSWAH